jgi:hypothetical protein
VKTGSTDATVEAPVAPIRRMPAKKALTARTVLTVAIRTTSSAIVGSASAAGCRRPVAVPVRVSATPAPVLSSAPKTIGSRVPETLSAHVT